MTAPTLTLASELVGASIPFPNELGTIPEPVLTPGTRLQRCKRCGRVFGGTHVADRHRVIASTYDLVRDRSGNVARREPGVRLPGDGVTLSIGNERRRCLSDDELVGKGYRKAGNGVWGERYRGATAVPHKADPRRAGRHFWAF